MHIGILVYNKFKVNKLYDIVAGLLYRGEERGYASLTFALLEHIQILCCVLGTTH